MSIEARCTPIIIGVGDIRNASTKVEDAREPADLMLDAIHHALQETGLNSAIDLRSQIDSIDVVRTWTWAYGDLPGLLAEKLNITSPLKHKLYTVNGGNQPARILDEAARRISRGETAACSKSNHFPPPGWTPADENAEIFAPGELGQRDDIGSTHMMGAPIQIYPLYENGFRARRDQSFNDNNQESAVLYAKFSQVASNHQFAWNYGKPPMDAKEIGTISKTNRMICHPYPLFMNAFNTVNMAAACLLTSTEHAKKLGIPEDRWIYVLGGAGTEESKKWLDPRRPTKPITVLGGLTSFGGAGNNYSMHAITEIVRQLRNPSTKKNNGLVLANGGVLTYQHVICLSKHPRKNGQPYPAHNPLPETLTDLPIPQIVENAEGEATIETYTIEYSRTGTPETGYIVGRLKNASNARFVAVTADDKSLERLVELAVVDQPIGKIGYVYVEQDGNDKGRKRNLFTFGGKTRL
uniref:Thiolase-like protein type 1 additional C-terminal domain-containing protein n=1 Tax=Talaromyces marneffei PM1 TaxID=1077442 RepID=A0A093W3L1_TALMA